MKKLLLFLTAMVAAITLTACSSSASSTNKLDEIKQKGKIVLGVSPDYAPYEFITSENGERKVVGADIDLANKIAEKLGVQVEIQEMAFDSLIAAVNSGKVDMIISGINPTDERKNAVDFSDTYFVSNQAFVIGSNAEDITSLDQLQGKKVGVQKGTTNEAYAKDQLKIPESNIQALTDVPSLLQDLRNGNIDVVLIPGDVAKIAINKNNDIKIASVVDENDPEAAGMAIAFKKAGDANKDLLEQVNAVIKEVKDQNFFTESLDKNAKLAAESEE